MIKTTNFFKDRNKLIIITGILCIALLGGILLTSRITNGNSKKDTVYGPLDSLLKYKTAYVGNNSKVINLINNLNYAEFKGVISLQTKKRPYVVTVNYNFDKVNIIPTEVDKAIRYNAIMLFSLINNVDVINFNLSGNLQPHYEFKRGDIQQGFLKDVRDYSKDIDSLNLLNNSINFIIYASPKKYSPAMSSTPGIQITHYQVSDTTVRYLANKGDLLTWDRKSGKIKSYGKSVELKNPPPIYWTPSNDKSIGKGKTYINLTILNKEGKAIIEKRIQILGSSEFTVLSCPDVIVSNAMKVDYKTIKNN